MSELAIEMRKAIVRLAGPRDWFDSRESWLAKAARAAGISPSSAKRLFYCEATNPVSAVVESVRAAIARIDAEQEAKARDEFAELTARIARIEAALRLSDADFHGPALDGFRAVSRSNGVENRALDRGEMK